MIGHGSGLGGSKYSIRLMKKIRLLIMGGGYTFDSGGKKLEGTKKLSEELCQKIKFKTNQTHSLQFVTGIKLKAYLFLQINIGWHQVLS